MIDFWSSAPPIIFWKIGTGAINPTQSYPKTENVLWTMSCKVLFPLRCRTSIICLNFSTSHQAIRDLAPHSWGRHAFWPLVRVPACPRTLVTADGPCNDTTCLAVHLFFIVLWLVIVKQFDIQWPICRRQIANSHYNRRLLRGFDRLEHRRVHNVLCRRPLGQVVLKGQKLR